MKPLYKDSTQILAAEAIAQVRAADNINDVLLVVSTVVDHLLRSEDFKDLVLEHCQAAFLDAMTQKPSTERITKQVVTDMTQGIVFGFRYAQFLAEQRELNKLGALNEN